MASPAAVPLDLRAEPAPPGAVPAAVTFGEIYNEHFAFVWRSLRRLGVRDAALDDAAQEVFLVVYRRLPRFEWRSSLKTWLFGIVLRVARTFRRTAQRRSAGEASLPDAEESSPLWTDPRPDEHAERAEEVRAFYALLDELGEEKREVFVLAELEQMTAPEISEAIGISVTNVYARLRNARQEFEQALARKRAREARRQP
jgi:RNA polymerase sigma-70 factor (ECF subfamily)